MAASSEQQKKVTIAICGDSGAGKTTMVHQLRHREFTAILKPTLGMDTVFWRRNNVAVEIRDISGQDSASVNNAAYFRGVQAAVVVCDATKTDTVTSGLLWYNEARDKLRIPTGAPLPLMMVFNKMDLVGDAEQQAAAKAKLLEAAIRRLSIDESKVRFTTAHSHEQMLELFDTLIAIHDPYVEKQAPKREEGPQRPAKNRCEC